MTDRPRTTQILHLLGGMDHATADMIHAHIQCARAEVLKTLRNMRARGVVATEDGKNRITAKGREELQSGPPQRSVIHAPFKVPSTKPARAQSEYLLAKPSEISVSHENSVMRRPTWTPEPWVPARPGADAHKACASRGIA